MARVKSATELTLTVFMLDREINILIVEDAETDAELLVHRLNKYEFTFGYDWMNTANGLDEKLLANSYDIVISDFNLPGSNGIEVLRKVKKYDSMLPFILLSGSISKSQETEILELGANEVIMKSNLNRLPFAIRRVLYEVEDKKKLQATKLKLERSLKRKEVLLKEVHHRVKNNLQIISGLLQLRQMETDDEKVSRITADLLLKIRSIAVVHEKLYQSEDLANIDLPDLIEDLTTYILEIISGDDRKYDLECKVAPIQLNVNQAVPCGLIISELVHNCIQHAFSGQKEGKIAVLITGSGNRIKVKVTDNGLGLPQDFSFEGSGLGLGATIVNTLFRQLNADYQVKSNEGSDITFEFDKTEKSGSQSSLV